MVVTKLRCYFKIRSNNRTKPWRIFQNKLILVLAGKFKVDTHSTPVETSQVQFLPFLKKLGFWFFKKRDGSSSGFGSGSGSTKKTVGPVQVPF
jgi:hypothetical protein